jgi:hypothetical protein
MRDFFHQKVILSLAREVWVVCVYDAFQKVGIELAFYVLILS